MESTIAIAIDAGPDTVYALAADVENWPRVLPHYRWVKRLDSRHGQLTVEMAARRDLVPVRWTAVVEPVPASRRLRFTHVAGPTRGMQVEWRIDALDGGRRSHVQIWHRFLSTLPLISPVYEWVAFHVFVENIAGKTLRCMKREAERAAIGSRQ